MEDRGGHANEEQKRAKVRCPVCGYIMPITYTDDAECQGVFASCKGRNCKTVFEIIIKNGQQYK